MLLWGRLKSRMEFLKLIKKIIYQVENGLSKKKEIVNKCMFVCLYLAQG